MLLVQLLVIAAQDTCTIPVCEMELAACRAELTRAKADCAQKRQSKPKVKKPVAKKPPSPKVEPAPAQTCCPSCCGKTEVVVNIHSDEPTVRPMPPEKPFSTVSQQTWVSDAPMGGIGIRGAVGIWSCNPHVFGLVGLRGRYFPAHLGLELNTQFYWGHSAQLLVYPVQGRLSWHVDAGVLWFYHYGFATQDVPRNVDVLVGTGLEFVVVKHLSLTADWRATFPNPVVVGGLVWSDANGRVINTGNVVGNSFARSQFMLGVMLHTW